MHRQDAVIIVRRKLEIKRTVWSNNGSTCFQCDTERQISEQCGAPRIVKKHLLEANSILREGDFWKREVENILWVSVLQPAVIVSRFGCACQLRTKLGIPIMDDSTVPSP